MLNIKDELQRLADDIKKEILRRMESDVGVNQRTGTNTLVGSDLYRSVNVTTNGNDELVFSILQHWEYIVLGWKHTGRFPGTRDQFLENLGEWIRRKGIHIGNMTQTQMVYVIYRQINMEGIKARPFITYDPHEDPAVILPFLDEYFNKWADNIFEAITKSIDSRF